ncbi:branched-chain amino acid aminotransferase [Nibrella viscosa]
MTTTEQTPTKVIDHKPTNTGAAFGSEVSAHMLMGVYRDGQWQEQAIVPFGPLMLSPTNLALHYGQSIFEGMKAFRMKDGNISVFRIDKHHERLNKTLERMSMPQMPFSYFDQAIRELVAVDADYVPDLNEGSLYIRPFVFATGEGFRVRVSDTYQFVIFTGPVGDYYQKPVRVKVETEFIRAAEGGPGFAKCAGNYAAAFYPTQKANREGFDNLLWTDSRQHEFIEESGTMNAMFVIDEVLITPSLTGTILDGITRDSLIRLARDMGVKVQQRKISYKELIAGAEQGLLQEAFGVGTAAVVSPIELIQVHGQDYPLPPYSDNSLWFRLKQRLTQIRTGYEADMYGWNTVLDV